ncbi:hypothetical protein [Pseudomonas atacamensis]
MYDWRGLIPITGRASYAKCCDTFSLDLIKTPNQSELPQHAAVSAA